ARSSNSPRLAPSRKVRNSSVVWTSTFPFGKRELRIATRPSAIGASSTHEPLGLLCALLRHLREAVSPVEVADSVKSCMLRSPSGILMFVRRPSVVAIAYETASCLASATRVRGIADLVRRRAYGRRSAGERGPARVHRSPGGAGEKRWTGGREDRARPGLGRLLPRPRGQPLGQAAQGA